MPELALTVDYLKSDSFCRKIERLVQDEQFPRKQAWQTLYWKVEDAENDGYPVFTDQDPRYTGVESVVSGVRIYPTTVSGELFVCGAESPIYICNPCRAYRFDYRSDRRNYSRGYVETGSRCLFGEDGR